MLYEFLIWTIIALKLIYLIDFFRTTFGWYTDKDVLLGQRENIMFVSELLMYLLLIIVFFPRGKIIITGHEKNIFLILGIIGIIQTLKYKTN